MGFKKNHVTSFIWDVKAELSKDMERWTFLKYHAVHDSFQADFYRNFWDDIKRMTLFIHLELVH